MRRSMQMSFFAALALSFLAAPAPAETLATDAELHAKPSARSATLALLGAGLEVTVESARGDGWSRVSTGEFSGFVRSAAIAPYNPGCDLGYPYSGSARYFDGLTAMRTSGPLGFFLGYHVARPC